ncbi:MAG: oligosaccharide flippase family protein [Saprospiraceae bacterium]
MSQLKRDTQMTLMSRIPVMLLSFLSVVLLTRLLGPEGNGVYTFIYAGLNLFITIIGFQLDGSLTFFLSNKGYDNNKVLSTIGSFFLLTILVFVLVLFFIIYLIPGGQHLFIPDEQPVFFFLCFLAISFTLRTASNLIQAALRGLFRFKSFNIYITIIQLFPVLLYGMLLYLSLSSRQNFPMITIFKIILISESILLLTGIFILWKTHEINFSPDIHTYRKSIVHYSSKNLLGTVGHFLNKRLDVWFVEFYRGMNSLGQYGLATQITNFISEALTPFNQVLLPYLSGSSTDQHNIMVGRIARLNFCFAIIAAMMIAGLSWLFIPLLFGHKFDQAIPASQILSIGIIFISQRLVFTNYFKATNQISYAIKASWGGVIITVVLDLILIPLFGIIGASIASVFAYGTTAIFLVYHVSKKIDLSLRDIIFIKKSDIIWLLSRKPETDHSSLKNN